MWGVEVKAKPRSHMPGSIPPSTVSLNTPVI